jgi:hypothetical protein
MRQKIYLLLLMLLAAGQAPAAPLILLQDGFSGGSVRAASANFVLEQATGFSLGGGNSSSAGYLLAGGFYPIGTQTTGVSISEGTDPSAVSLPKAYALQACWPNPSSGRVSFGYQLPRASDVSLTVYNIAGQAVKRFDLGSKPAGQHKIEWNGSQTAAGVYFYRLQAGVFSAIRKLMIVR